jgi:MFS family permease
MTISRLQRLILALYPAAFRARYGEELAAVVAECDGGWRVDADLALSAAKARLRPDFFTSSEGQRGRLETTTGTVFAVWAWSAVAVVVFARAVDDQPGPGLKSWGWSAYAIGNALLALCAALILISGFAYWLLVVIRATRARSRRTLVSALMPLGLGLVWLAATGTLAVATNRIQTGNYRHIDARGPQSAGGWVLLAGYAAFTVLVVALCTASVRRTLTRARLPVTTLKGSSLIAATATAGLAGITACAVICLSFVLVVGGTSTGERLMAVGAVSFLLLATVTATSSAFRGLHAIKGPRRITP